MVIKFGNSFDLWAEFRAIIYMIRKNRCGRLSMSIENVSIIGWKMIYVRLIKWTRSHFKSAGSGYLYNRIPKIDILSHYTPRKRKRKREWSCEQWFGEIETHPSVCLATAYAHVMYEIEWQRLAYHGLHLKFVRWVDKFMAIECI